MTTTRKARNPHIAESFDSFLREEGIYESVQTTAIKRVLAMKLEEAMKQHRITIRLHPDRTSGDDSAG